MRDKSNVKRIEKLHPAVRAEVEATIDLVETNLPKNIAVRIPDTGGFRSFDEQAALYAQGRTKPGKIVTDAKPGQGFHNYGLAFDFCLVVDKDGNGTWDEASWDIRKDNDKDGVADWLEVVKAFEADGWRWGGKWATIKDYPHLQKTFGYSWQELLQKYIAKDFLPGTNYIRL